jgi:hypothetical protein
MFYCDNKDGCLPWLVMIMSIMSNYGNEDNDHDDYDIIECLCITVTIKMVACRGHDSEHNEHDSYGNDDNDYDDYDSIYYVPIICCMQVVV